MLLRGVFMLNLNPKEISGAVKEFCEIEKFKNLKIHFQNAKHIISVADEFLDNEIKILPLSKYRLYDTEGNRTKYEAIEFARRREIFYLAFAEIADGKKGKYLKKIMDLLWAICEETTWVLPAHNDTKYGNHIPHEFGEKFEWVDIFAAADGACVAVVYYLLKDEFEKEIPKYFNERIEYELNRRVVSPFLSEYHKWHDWKGLDDWYVNNWNPWIVSNALTVALLVVKDIDIRKEMVEKGIGYLNHYLKYTFEDGACIEGATYYTKSNCCVFDILELVYYLTEGEVNYLSHPYLKKLMEYLPNMYADKGYYFTMSDFTRRERNINGEMVLLLKRANETLKSESISTLLSKFKKDVKTNGISLALVYTSAFRALLNVTVSPSLDEFEEKALPSNYMESVEIMTVRENDFVCFFKAGNNHEPHGHDDVGQFEIYHKGEPLFIDPGVEAYSASSFTSNRKWCYSSEYHNTPTLNGHAQQSGYQGDFNIQYGSTNVNADFENYRFSLELKKAYIEDSGIVSAVRTMQMTDGKISIEDNFEFEKEGEYIFNLMSIVKPEVKENTLEFEGKGEKTSWNFTKGYNVSFEELVLEDEGLIRMWQTEKIYRTRISTKAKKGSFKLYM